jgi:hypothetical protein
MQANPWLNRDVLSKRRKERLNWPLASIHMDYAVDNVSDLINAESEHVAVLTTGIKNTATDITIKIGGRPKGSTKESNVLISKAPTGIEPCCY